MHCIDLNSKANETERIQQEANSAIE